MDLDGPALAPPEGETSNLVDPPNQNGLALATIIACSTIATICVLLRGYARVYLAKKCQLEEVLTLIAYGCYWGCITALIKFLGAPGYFVHQWNVTLRDLMTTQYWLLIFGVCFAMVMPCLKAAILTEWCRIFIPHGNRKRSLFWWTCILLIFVHILASLAIIVSLNLQCTPHDSIWYFAKERKCWDIYSLQVVVAGLHLAGDIIIFFLPQQKIWSLKMSIRRKLGISLIFSLGLLACISAGARLVVTVLTKSTSDNTYKLAQLVFWATSEMTCAFVVVGVPCVARILKETGLLRKIKRRFGMKTNTTGSGRTGNEYGGGSSGLKSGPLSTSGSRAYCMIDEEVIQLKTLGDSESQEYLNDGKQSPTSGVVVTRTMKVSIEPVANTYHPDGPDRSYISPI